MCVYGGVNEKNNYDGIGIDDYCFDSSDGRI